LDDIGEDIEYTVVGCKAVWELLMGLQLLGKTLECWACDMQPKSLSIPK